MCFLQQAMQTTQRPCHTELTTKRSAHAYLKGPSDHAGALTMTCFTKAPCHRCIKLNPRYQAAYTTPLTRSHGIQRSVSRDFICSMLFEHHEHGHLHSQ